LVSLISTPKCGMKFKTSLSGGDFLCKRMVNQEDSWLP
jgi:hypothetical protein